MGIERALHHNVVLIFHHDHIPIQTKLAYPIMSTDIDSAMSQPLYCQSMVAGAQFT